MRLLHPHRLPRNHLAALYEHHLPITRLLGCFDMHAVAFGRHVVPALVLAAIAAHRHDADPVAIGSRAAETNFNTRVGGNGCRQAQRDFGRQYLHRL